METESPIESRGCLAGGQGSGVGDLRSTAPGGGLWALGPEQRALGAGSPTCSGAGRC